MESTSGELDSALNAVLAGHGDAFMFMVRQYRPGIRSYLASQMYHLDDVDDVAQEVFLSAYRGLSNYRRELDFGAWLRGIARHKLLKYYEKSGRQQTALDAFRREGAQLLESELEQEAAAIQSEHLQAMLGCIPKLPERMRAVVRSWLDGRRSATLAEDLNISVGAVYQLQYRALKLLRDCITQELAS